MASEPEHRQRGVARRFNLGDLMIVVVAVAVGCGAVRAFVPDSFEYVSPSNRIDETHLALVAWYFRCRVGLMLLTIGLMVASGAVLVLRLRRPRPGRRRLMRQPGWVACLAASAAGALTLLVLGAKRYADGLSDLGEALLTATLALEDGPFARLIHVSAAAVLVGWLVLALGGTWAAERSWVDRLGRAVGVGWVVALVAEVGSEFLWLAS